MGNTKILGAYASVDFPEFGIFDAVAKIDTGAMSGAIHATKIEQNSLNNKPVLSFYPNGDPSNKVVTEKFNRKRIRSSNGQAEERYIVDTTIVINGETYPISISLSNRSQMRKAVLIGKRFLKDNRFLVDVGRRAKYGSSGKDDKL